LNGCGALFDVYRDWHATAGRNSMGENCAESGYWLDWTQKPRGCRQPRLPTPCGRDRLPCWARTMALCASRWWRTSAIKVRDRSIARGSPFIMIGARRWRTRRRRQREQGEI